MTIDPVLLAWAFALGAASAASLPLGSWTGLVAPPSQTLLGFLIAFGAGALLAALAIELVAPTVQALHEEGAGDRPSGEALRAFLAMGAGMAAGSALFIALDQIVNARGGFLRKSAATAAWLAQRKQRRHMLVLGDLGRMEALQSLPQEAIGKLVELVRPVDFKKGDILFRQGDPARAIYFVRTGDVQLFQGGVPIVQIGPEGVLGEWSLMAGKPRADTAEAMNDVHCLMLRKGDFNRLRKRYRELETAILASLSRRIDALQRTSEERETASREWAERASDALQAGVALPAPEELRAVHREHEGAPMAIWLGILLDGVPESFVIGTGLAALVAMHEAAGSQPALVDTVPYTLIAGLFLSNFPEALSSSVGMKEQGMAPRYIFGLWASLALMTGLGAVLGYAVGGGLSPVAIAGVNGAAAGAMLTMIAAAMLPEAAYRGGPVVSGAATMLGFGAAIAFKLLE